MGFSFGSLFSGDALWKSALSGGLTTAHSLNKAGYDKLFPKAPDVPEPPPAPTINDAEAAAEDKSAQLRRRRGLASTILAGANSYQSNQPTTQAAALLGS